ncbi:MAG: 50S ribosomal protein L24e [Candidatus Woesearchaeota archaeon]
MVNCSFSGKELPKWKGRMLIRNNGRILYFVNSKAMKNFLKLGRKSLKTRWTADYKKSKEIRLSNKK